MQFHRLDPTNAVEECGRASHRIVGRSLPQKPEAPLPITDLGASPTPFLSSPLFLPSGWATDGEEEAKKEDAEVKVKEEEAPEAERSNFASGGCSICSIDRDPQAP